MGFFLIHLDVRFTELLHKQLHSQMSVAMNWSVGAGMIGHFVCEGIGNYVASKENINGSMLTAFERRGCASTHCVGCP